MGAEPRWATLALTLPASEERWLEGFARGFREIAVQFGVDLVGGDISAGPLSVAVQIMGVVPRGTALRRDAARAGDEVYVTGELGGAALALQLLEDGGKPPAECLRRLHRPVPRVATGSGLRGIARAAIDVSDGLFLDLARVAQASAVGAAIELQRVPLCGQLAAITDPEARLRIGLGTGDDYELCFTAPPDNARQLADLAARTGVPVTCIGTVTAGGGVRWLLEDGREFQPGHAGYRHF
jgi:thiamine-monophosphate kinase